MGNDYYEGLSFSRIESSIEAILTRCVFFLDLVCKTNSQQRIVSCSFITNTQTPRGAAAGWAGGIATAEEVFVFTMESTAHNPMCQQMYK